MRNAVVDRDAPAVSVVDRDRVRVAPELGGRLEDRDVVRALEHVRRGDAGRPSADDGDAQTFGGAHGITGGNRAAPGPAC